jgi:hypothetical protein
LPGSIQLPAGFFHLATAALRDEMSSHIIVCGDVRAAASADHATLPIDISQARNA